MYFFLDRFGLAPDVTLTQDDTLMSDVMLFDRQLQYKKWARQNNEDFDDDPEWEGERAFGPEVVDYRSAFGVPRDS